MSYTYDTEPTTSYTNDGTASLISWDDTESLWDDPNASWDGLGTIYTYDTELSTSYTNDTI